MRLNERGLPSWLSKALWRSDEGVLERAQGDLLAL